MAVEVHEQSCMYVVYIVRINKGVQWELTDSRKCTAVFM